MPRFEGTFTIADAKRWVGQEMALSDWLELDQSQVTAFGELTNHDHWLHMDPARAVDESPYGGTIAQGFLMLDFIIYFSDQTGLRPADSVYNLNYGFDKVRYLVPVVTGDGVRLRDRISLLSVEPKGEGRKLMKTSHVMEVEGSDEPALYAEWLALWVHKDVA